LARVVDGLAPASVLDVGSGDGEATRLLRVEHYTGIDVSPAAVRRAGAGRPAGEFLVGTLSDHRGVTADLTLCLDVLIHQADRSAYEELVEQLLQSATRAALVSGYEHRPTTDSPMVHYHEPLTTTVRRLAPHAEVYPVREEQEVTTLLVLHSPASRHPRDFEGAALRTIVHRHPSPLRLAELRLRAWTTTGFYPDHAPRLWEYPAVVDAVLARLRSGRSLVDVGAGVTPLAPFLTRLGYAVDTVDPSPLRRPWPPGPRCNEWGFVDYAAVGLARRSWNCTVDALPARRRYDGAVSVSVIEHLPADDRRTLLRELAGRVRRHGLLVLTVDLARGTDDLWNRSLGEVDDADSPHGTFDDLVAECGGAGFRVTEVDRVRDWGDVPVDIGWLVAERSRPGRRRS
jgi:2-polyprenyl-3-methyl-5-hydroxy-6-metoxy-1,4-benzoquinol methylase